MNIINKLTIRQLKLNKKRTLVTIIGVIISVAMVTAVATLAVSFMDLLQRETIARDGEWHVLYNNVNKEQIKAIYNDEETKNVILSRDTGYAALEGSQNKNKPYIFIKEYNNEGFDKFPVELKEGRFPQSPDEIVISEAILTNAKVEYKIGDKLDIDIGQRYSLVNEEDNGVKMPLNQNSQLVKDENGINETLAVEENRQYTIVGIIERPSWEPTWSPGYTALSYVDENYLASDSKVIASVVLNKVNGKLFNHAKDFAELNKIKEVGFNNELLRYYGVVGNDITRNMLYNLCAIIIGIIMVGSISLIYNAFAISVSERSRHLGMMSSVGATKKQKRNSVLFEGVAIGLISIPLGILSGFAGIGITFFFINPVLRGALSITEGLRLVIMPSSIIIAVVISVITILISTYIPARRASNISAIDAIRQTSDIKITRRQIKTTKLTRKIFGIEGELGLKNLKRNRAKYKATVFSLIISMVLFLAVSYFTSSMEKALVLSQDGVNFDIQVYINAHGQEKDDIVQHIKSLNNINDLISIDTLSLRTWIDEHNIADYLKNDSYGILDGKYPYYVYVNALDDDKLKEYAKDVGVEYSLLKDANNLKAIVIDTTNYKDYTTQKYVETKVIKSKVGEKLSLNYYDYETEDEIILQNVEIAALTDKLPMGIMTGGQNADLNIIVSHDTLNKIVKSHEKVSMPSTMLCLISNDPLKVQEEIEEYEDIIGEEKIYAYNFYASRQQEQQMILLMSVFVYGFITLIVAICTANIFNTISTSIALRKREFAMLKSVGMTPKGFNKMINYESIFYGIKALLYGLPISIGVVYLIYRAMDDRFSFALAIPWFDIGIMVVAVFVIVGMAMLYSGAKVKKENIIDVLKQEII